MRGTSDFAWAKVNLSLHVLGRRADGYHELASLVAFTADIFDTVTFTPGADLSVDVAGAFADAISGPNLIERAALAMAASYPDIKLGRFRVDKRIPVAAGIGGGSADAAAALRLIAAHNGLRMPDPAMRGLAAGIGADVPVCLAGGQPAAAFMTGIGENVVRAEPDGMLGACDIWAVLANPGVAVPTGGVFAALGAAPLSVSLPPSDVPPKFADNAALLAYLDGTRNDLEVPAIGLVPVIRDVLAGLRVFESCRLARMSGSGATCFGLFETEADAHACADRLKARFAHWWIGVSRLA